VLQGVLIDQAIAVLFQRARDFGWATRARAIHEAMDPLVGKAVDPLAEGGIGEVQRLRDRLETLALNDIAHGLGTAKDAGFFRLF
jgi:hypothetical protein